MEQAEWTSEGKPPNFTEMRDSEIKSTNAEIDVLNGEFVTIFYFVGIISASAVCSMHICIF